MYEAPDLDLAARFRTRLPIFQVDAFTAEVFGGNPAAVCPLPRWLPDDTLRAIAIENALPETAFLVGAGDTFEIRWLLPDGQEIDLCGHATLAAAHVLASHLNPALREIRFHSKSGPLRVKVDDDWITLDFPSRPPFPTQAPATVLAALGLQPAQVRQALQSRDLMLVLDHEDTVRRLRPDPALLQRLPGGTHGIIVTAPGEQVDFVSRFFIPGSPVPEDPVTGSAHCTLIPWWAGQLGKDGMMAAQLSARGGLLRCQLAGERVLIGGQAVTYLEGHIRV
ncbi:MAG: PhzF family phenazine biosynthesis protein [Lautropia sp.]|nr:PhzF family phenazine biosynthesis protein [Lautropia sp.]